MAPMTDHDTDLARLARDIAELARLAGAPSDRAIVARTLEIFEAGFRRCPVELRTTSVKPGHSGAEASFRYIDPQGSHDPFGVAVSAGALLPAERPVDRLVPELQSRFPVFGYGVDATAAFGLEKIWPFMDRPRPLEEAFGLSSLPPAVALSEPWLRRHGLTHFSVIAADYRHESANLYFALTLPFAAAERLPAMLSDLGMAAPPPDAIVYNVRASVLGVTYSWRKDTPERLCFYVPEPSGADLSSLRDPMLRAIAQNTPVLVPERRFVIGSSFGARGAYTKLEIDYTGTSVPLFQKWVERLSRARTDTTETGGGAA